MHHRLFLLLFLAFFSVNSVAGVIISSEMMTSHFVDDAVSHSLNTSSAMSMPSNCDHGQMAQDQTTQQDKHKHDSCNDCQFCFAHVLLNTHEQAFSPSSYLLNSTLKTLFSPLVVSRLNRPPQS